MMVFDQKGVSIFFFQYKSKKNIKFDVFSYQNFRSQMSIRVLPIEMKLSDEISTYLTPWLRNHYQTSLVTILNQNEPENIRNS